MAVIEKNMVVTLHYTLRNESSDGRIIEDTFENTPLTFNFGVGQMIAGFETHLEGKKAGDKFAFLLSPEEAYGIHKQTSIVDIPLSNFRGTSGKINQDAIKVGRSIKMKNQNGQSFQGIILSADDITVKVDFNHPMAGRRLYFSGIVLDVNEELGLN